MWTHTFGQHLKNNHQNQTPCMRQRERTFVTAQYLSSFRVFFNVLDDIDQIRDFREEGVIISESHCRLTVVSRAPNIKYRCNVGIDKPVCIALAQWKAYKKHQDMLQTVSIRVDFEFTTIISPLKSNDMSETSYGPTVILPNNRGQALSRSNNRNRLSYQVAAVTRGIRFSGAILLSSIDILESFPAFSCHWREWAWTDGMSTSPPKYRDKSQKWVPCSMIGPALQR